MTVHTEKTAHRVEACIADVMARFPGESKAAQARYFEEVHQDLAPLARELERQNDELRAEVERLRAEVAAGAARQGGGTSDLARKLIEGHGKTISNMYCDGEPVGKQLIESIGSAPTAGTEKDAERLNFLDTNVRRFRMGWEIGAAPAGNLSVRSIIRGGLPIREAIDAAKVVRAKAETEPCAELNQAAARSGAEGNSA